MSIEKIKKNIFLCGDCDVKHIMVSFVIGLCLFWGRETMIDTMPHKFRQGVSQ